MRPLKGTDRYLKTTVIFFGPEQENITSFQNFNYEKSLVKNV